MKRLHPPTGNTSMTRTFRILAALMGVVLALGACRRDVLEPAPAAPGSPVTFDPSQGPHATLSAYGFFRGPLNTLDPAQGVLPYDLIDPLFSDHAKKHRHVWLPPGTRATWDGAGRVLAFPDGAVLLKTFYYDGVLPALERRIVETRMMYRWQGEWFFAEYVWNEAQTEATLDMAGSLTPVAWQDGVGQTNQVTYRIPSELECRTCHRTEGVAMPIGPKPRNLARPYAYSDGMEQQLDRWIRMGLLEDGLPFFEPMPDWRDTSRPMQDRVRAYIDINCAHCHAEGSYCDYRPMRFAWEETLDPVNLGLCVAPHDPIQPDQLHIVSAGRPDRSMMVHRVAATHEAVRMPLLGRTVVHDEALSLIQDWIASLSPPCP